MATKLFLDALSAIKEVCVSKLVDFSLEKLASSDLLQFATQEKVLEEIQNLEKELKQIRRVLDDAEDRQVKEQLVKDWLIDLQNLAFDVEDVLDEFATEIGRRNLMMERRGSSSKRSRLNIPQSFNDVLFNRDIMSKIRDLTAKLKDLEPQRNKLELRMTDRERPTRLEERLQPTSLEIENHVYGRDKDKQTIRDLLLKSDEERNFVIPILGMGGIGKTTLAQLVYNDASIQNHFHLKAWACVSDYFDVLRITKDILQSITSVSCNDNDLNIVQEKLQKELSGKKFLIVLDDVWNENYHDWTILQSPFKTRTQGSKIIVTTRNHGVSSTMGALHTHSLQLLSDDDCLSVFAQHALGARDFEGHPSLKEVAEKIVRKCNGLPLAAKTLGGLLRTNVDLHAWEDVLESEIWKLSKDQSSIIPALQVSYHHFPLHLKRCFMYCAIIPKDYEFEKEEIILLWRAQGFLQEARDKQCIHDLGHKYFNDLVSRSLLQVCVNSNSRFVMHDLINDLAQSVAGEVCFKIEGSQQISKHARHLSYIAERFDGIKKFEGIYEAQHLRTFLPLRFSWDNYLTNPVLTNLLPNLRCLRALSLAGYQIIMLPDFVGDLKLLRYLNFSQNSVIKCVPKSVSTLYNLETFLLKGCWNLEKLPSEMEKLVNLCYLDITGADKLESMASNFSMLTNLQKLSSFVLGKEKGHKIRELMNLSNLRGELCISGLQNIAEPRDAWMARLSDKSRLENLELQWSKDFENRREEVEKKVLDGLQPSMKLMELSIKFYCGEMLANWVGDSSFNCLQSLCLDDCINLLSLPSIGKLPLLKKVRIKGLRSVRTVGVELFGENTTNTFSSLEILEFEDMLNWEKWNLCEVDEEARKFPKLRELLIQNCPLLLGSMPEYLPSLKKLTIRSCGKLIISVQNFPLLSELEIHGCHEVIYKGFVDYSSIKRISFVGISKFSWAAECLRLRSIKVESFEIGDCEELCSSRDNNWGLLTQSMSPQYLRIEKCPQLVSIATEEEREELMQLKIPSSIVNMRIENCERLEKLSTTLYSLALLMKLELYGCSKLISIARSNLPSNLKVLIIRCCINLQCLLLDEGEDVDSNNACVLRELNIVRCESLKRINRSVLPSTLKTLQIHQCPKLESISQEIQDNSSLESIEIYRCDILKGLPQGLNKLKHCKRLVIEDCSNLISLGESGLPTTLKVLEINECPKLESISQEIQDNSSLESIEIGGCDMLKGLPQGLNKLKHCKILVIEGCSNLISLGESGLPTTNLEVLRLNFCRRLQALPGNMHSLNALKELEIRDCPNVTSILEEGIPTYLTSLKIGGPNIWKAKLERDLHTLTCLKSLSISNGCPDVVSFPQDEIEVTLPSSLTNLFISDFPKPESLSSNGFRNLTSLQRLTIGFCPNLKTLPGNNMLFSLLKLKIVECPMMGERCKRDKGPEWSKISHIPCVDV
ncbi:hypothetical protein ES332_D10G240400v1 [Gossypium tomentosum]|uniref:NB-ARC domain-containing protein n=1 Tax=Gossypium tomentosum TaxID=34277 RepID=A0A5D2J908_GOSTO|nr:hypothetical protein ES332_D10G240400v1 [Gossypium tomentosum]